MYLFSPHPLYPEVDRMMVMDVKCIYVTHFHFRSQYQSPHPLLKGTKLAIKKSMLLIGFNDIISYWKANVKFF